MAMVEQLVSRTDAAYRRWLASVTDDVAADGVVVYCRESLPERNTTYAIGEWLTGYLMIGQEGDRGFFLRSDDGGGPVFSADLGGLGEVDLAVVAPVFEVWLRSGFALPAEPEPDLPPTADVYVDGIPVDRVQLLARARKILGVDWRFGDFRSLLAAQPFLAARSARLYVLLRDLEGAPSCGPTCCTPPITAWKRCGRPKASRPNSARRCPGPGAEYPHRTRLQFFEENQRIETESTAGPLRTADRAIAERYLSET
ncbi:hypothetical protein [Micromonospora sp. WMMC250]|uniref:hypothetical protein n=1 Tax=Micromonospora sp. WMMC250 TaxID=3014781 RepID=UPI0022B6993D|nr:hypothetical protein [Micromonospora sp. WMMC250]MCZ7373775.1 hypothetical protein [Micromonospora sp. WMMC250]